MHLITDGQRALHEATETGSKGHSSFASLILEGKALWWGRFDAGDEVLLTQSPPGGARVVLRDTAFRPVPHLSQVHATQARSAFRFERAGVYYFELESDEPTWVLIQRRARGEVDWRSYAPRGPRHALARHESVASA